MRFKIVNIKLIINAAIILIIFSLAIYQQKAEAQQMFVDDAGVTTYRSFQVETWYGTEESWFLMAISPLPALELGIGTGFSSDDLFDPLHWVFEAKIVPMDLEEEGWAYGMASGLLYDFDANLEEFFAYLAYSKMILHDSSVLHVNLGWESVDEGEGMGFEHGLIKGIRGDFGITEHVSLLSEFAVMNFEDTFYQGGIRIGLIPGLLEMDITYGEGVRRMETAPGFNVGIAFTPDALW